MWWFVMLFRVQVADPREPSHVPAVPGAPARRQAGRAPGGAAARAAARAAGRRRSLPPGDHLAQPHPVFRKKD